MRYYGLSEMENKQEVPTLWGMESDDYVTCETQEERIRQYLEYCKNDYLIPKESIELIGYVRVAIDKERWASYAVRKLLEAMDEHNIKKTNKDLEDNPLIERAAIDLMDVVCDFYKSDGIREVCRRTVNLKLYKEVQVNEKCK